MRFLKYFFQFFIIIVFFFIFKIIGIKYASNLSSKIISLIGPFFRSKKIIESNLLKAIPNLSLNDLKETIEKMWGNYGRILSDYVFIKDFRNSDLNNNIQIEGQEILEKIKKDNEPVIFVSGHFNNFELMAMHLEKSGLPLVALYRPLNNQFLNYVMERIRKKYICKNQVKKGISGTKHLLSFFKKGSSIALMIDQRVSEGIMCDFFKHQAFTTTIPAQFVKKFKCKIVPIYIQRTKDINFKLTVHKPLEYSRDDSIQFITSELNIILEKMILKDPEQWIWSHNRWK
jgi:Kdo2-lipid IVA lauroyltransferase/acyltransferase